MAKIIYPKCKNDDIRKKDVDFINPLETRDYKPQKGNEVCAICAPGRRIIAYGNEFDYIKAERPEE